MTRHPARTALGLFAGCLLTAGLPAQENAGTWYKGNLHTHSLWSDGNDFPEVIAKWYRDHGYDFLALSDHNILSDHEKWMDVDLVVRHGGRRALQRYREQFGADWVQTREVEGKLQVRLRRLDEFAPLLAEPGGFLMIQAEEVTASFGKLPIHINATNIAELVRPVRGGSVRRTIADNLDAIAEQGRRQEDPVLAHLNHPNFGYAVTAEDLAAVLSERFFEVWNGHNSVNHRGDELHAPVERIWDIANTLRIARFQAPPLFGLGTDDSHHYFAIGPGRSNSGRGWVMVRAAELTPRAIVRALQAGDFYASSGVTLDEVAFDGKTLQLRIAPVAGESYVTRFVGTLVDHDPTFEPVRDADGTAVAATYRYSPDVGAVLAEVRGTEASYRLRGDELYVRAVVTSSAAPARPVYPDQRQKAWTQPVGWRHRVLPDDAPRLGATLCRHRAGGPLRGLTTDQVGALFWSFRDELVKTDAAGRFLARVEAIGNQGDLTFWRDAVYVIVAGEAGLRVEVRGASDLQLRRQHDLGAGFGPTAAIACRGGRFFLSGRRPEDSAVQPVYEYDAGFGTATVHEMPVDPEAPALIAGEFCEGRFWFLGASPPGLLIADLDLRAAPLHPLPAAAITAIPGGRYLLGQSPDGQNPARALLALPDPQAGLRTVR